MSTIGAFNFKIDLDRSVAYLPGMYLKDAKYMLSGADTPIRTSTRDGQNLIHFSGHPIISGTYRLDCLDENCCRLRLSNDTIRIELVYNGDVLLGETRACE